MKNKIKLAASLLAALCLVLLIGMTATDAKVIKGQASVKAVEENSLVNPGILGKRLQTSTV